LTDRNLELDIWIPSLKKAIEINGIYWHSKKDVMRRDKMKKMVSNNLNISLFIVTDKEWLCNKNEVKNNLRKFIGV